MARGEIVAMGGGPVVTWEEEPTGCQVAGKWGSGLREKGNGILVLSYSSAEILDSGPRPIKAGMMLIMIWEGQDSCALVSSVCHIHGTVLHV